MRAATPPREKLRAFMAGHARPDADVEFCLILIDEALKRYDCSLLAGKDISAKAKHLADAAGKFAKALEITCALEIDKDAGITRDGQTSVWPFLRIANLMGKTIEAAGVTVQPRGDRFGDDVASALRWGKSSRLARCFDVAAGTAPALLSHVKAVERQAGLAAKEFSPLGGPPNTKEARLDCELEHIWKNLTGKKRRRSGAATFDNPRSYFGVFIKLAVEITDLG